MIALEEIESTVRRLGLLKDNTDSYEEKFVAEELAKNLAGMLQSYKAVVEQPNFKEIVEQYKSQMRDR